MWEFQTRHILCYIPKLDQFAIMQTGMLTIMTEIDNQLMDFIDTRKLFKKHKDAFIIDEWYE